MGQKGFQAGPGIDFYRFLVVFGVQLGLPLGDFWPTCRHFSDFSEFFSVSVFQSSFFRRFWQVPGPPGPLKYSKTTIGVHENTVPQKSEKLAPGVDFGSILVTFWCHFGDRSGHLGAGTAFFTLSGTIIFLVDFRCRPGPRLGL